jgi:hypothetical protein
MTRFGYFLSAEEPAPGELVRQARLAESAGFEALWISDHFHPWLDEQGQSSFVWSVVGAPSQATSLPVGTAVTCPTPRCTRGRCTPASTPGYDDVFVTRIGPDQDGFFDFYAGEVPPRLRGG